MLALRSLLLSLVAVTLAGCAGAVVREGFEDEQAAKPDAEAPAPPTSGFKETPRDNVDPVEPAEVHEVYGQSATTLYKLEPATKAVTVIGDFKNCEPVIDIALDERSTLYAVSYETLYTVDKDTAECSELSTGKYPNSLSFVPKGTIDANEEALVGYDGGDYIRIDLKSGERTVVGKLDTTGKLISSGDIVSVKGGKTFLTVKGNKATGCNETDCLVEVDPKTGKMLKNWGSIEHKKVFGLSFWGGKVYGFDDAGNLFEVTFGTNKIVTTTISIPQKPSDLSFWGAGSSTSAPLVATPQ